LEAVIIQPQVFRWRLLLAFQERLLPVFPVSLLLAFQELR
jgi:hypothetical protein